jgi:geranylgeranyl pyrophosphate synthase
MSSARAAGVSPELLRAFERASCEGSYPEVHAIPLLACEVAGGDPDAAVGVAAAWRALHLASKVLDDVMDGDAARVAGQDGVARLTAVGLGLYALSNRCLCGASPVAKAELSDAIHDTVLAMVDGQHREHTIGEGDTVEECLRTLDRKAGSFFELGVALGVRSSGKRFSGECALRDAGRDGGVLLQLADDLAGFRAEGTAGDLANGRRKLPVVYSLSVAAPAEAELLGDLLRRAVGDPEAERAARHLMHGLGAEAYILFEMQVRRRRIREAVESSGGAEEASCRLATVLGG